MPEKVITFCSQPVKVGCDGKCEKAWGTNHRPKVQLSQNVDDYAFLADGELGIAPAESPITEGGNGKPESAAEFPNRWCIRECERCGMSLPGKYAEPLELQDFSQRRYNIAPHVRLVVTT